MPPEAPGAVIRRIAIAQELHTFGALLRVWNTRWSMVFIWPIQLIYEVAARLIRRSQIGHCCDINVVQSLEVASADETFSRTNSSW